MATPTQNAADHLLDGTLDSFVADRRATGRAWAKIARDLFEATGGKIDVTHETLRSWYPPVKPVEVAS